MEHPLVGIVITPPVLPRLKRRPTDINSNQSLDLVSIPTKLERDLSIITVKKVTGEGK